MVESRRLYKSHVEVEFFSAEILREEVDHRPPGSSVKLERERKEGKKARREGQDKRVTFGWTMPWDPQEGKIEHPGGALSIKLNRSGRIEENG
jgi:hypothetical protein